MKHWYKTAMVGTKDDGTQYTVCTQMFYVDDDSCMADLTDVLRNAGIKPDRLPVKVYIAKNSKQMTDDKSVLHYMADVEKVNSLLFDALARGYGGKTLVEDAMAYGVHFRNVLISNAKAAYQVELVKCRGEDGGGDE